jgi:hypothetical protein
VAGAVYHGCLKPDAVNWPLLPENTRIKTECNTWVYEGSGHGLRLMLRLLYSFCSQNILPMSGGYLDQPRAFHEALRIFKSGEDLYKSKASENRETLSKLGAKNGKRS